MLLVPLSCAQAQAVPLDAATAGDSGWVPLFNGKAFGEDFYVYNNGKVPFATQTKFVIENGMIHAGGSYALLITNKEYGYYRIRVDYKFGADVGDGANAGMMILMDNEGAKTSTALRPRSIEINCRRDHGYPWTLWSSAGLGPTMTTTVKAGTPLFQAKADGGVAYTVDPSGNRTLESSYANPENPPGQWNRGEASVFGDSGVFFLNGRFRTASWKWSVNQAGKPVRVARGAVGVQTEGFDIWYRNWEIQELDSATLLPIHARRGCTDPAKPGYDPHAVVSEGSCGALPIAIAIPMAGRIPRSGSHDGAMDGGTLSGRNLEGTTLDGRASSRDPRSHAAMVRVFAHGTISGEPK